LNRILDSYKIVPSQKCTLNREDDVLEEDVLVDVGDTAGYSLWYTLANYGVKRRVNADIQK